MEKNQSLWSFCPECKKEKQIKTVSRQVFTNIKIILIIFFNYLKNKRASIRDELYAMLVKQTTNAPS